jgi:hypothetical protein
MKFFQLHEKSPTNMKFIHFSLVFASILPSFDSDSQTRLNPDPKHWCYTSMTFTVTRAFARMIYKLWGTVFCYLPLVPASYIRVGTFQISIMHCCMLVPISFVEPEPRAMEPKLNSLAEFTNCGYGYGSCSGSGFILLTIDRKILKKKNHGC